MQLRPLARRSTSGRSGAFWFLAVPAVVAAASLAACGSLPERNPNPHPLKGRALAEMVTVNGSQGALPDSAGRQTLRAVASEGNAALLARQLGVLATSGEVDLYRGNAARLLVDGPATLAAMKAAIEQAQQRVLLETYIIDGEGVAADIGDALMRKAGAGVPVALLYDAIGSINMPAAFFDQLRAAGVLVCAFNPINPLQQRKATADVTTRDHRKLLVVDNTAAFTGGINISDDYASSSFGSRPRRAAKAASAAAGANAAHKEGWRDTQVELRGPVVPALGDTFAKSWRDQHCDGEPLPSSALPAPAVAGERVVKVLLSEPSAAGAAADAQPAPRATMAGGLPAAAYQAPLPAAPARAADVGSATGNAADADAQNRIYTALLAAIDSAQRSVHITMAYFAPGPEFAQALCDAAQRGVDVQLLLPGITDFSLILHAGRAYYDQLLAAGVRIHEMDHTVMHAKTAVVDGVLSTVGSSNLDWRSLAGNHEISVIVLGDDFGQELETLFQRDLRVSKEVDRATWAQRGVRQRFMERFSRAVEKLL